MESMTYSWFPTYGTSYELILPRKTSHGYMLFSPLVIFVPAACYDDQE
jgi:hypothetical protein